MTRFSEIHSVEEPVTDWLTAMGWTLRPVKELETYQHPLANPVIETSDYLRRLEC